MGSYVFKWPHPNAKEVYVTGTFDDWGKTEKLNKVGETFEKDVELKSADEKILYKFVVDDQWTTDHTAPQEDDGHNNVNNVLHPKDIKPKGAITSTISSAAPGSTTAALAGQVPISGSEEKTEATSSAPGAFPETPANEGEFSVNPIPASSGVGNPVNVPAGEGVPHPSEVTPHTVDSTVTTSKEDYEKAGGITAGLAAVGAGVAAAAASVFGKPESKENVIPESSLPMGAAAGAADTTDTGPTIQSAAAHSTTAGLAAGVPLEPKREATVVGEDTVPESVPAAVKESIAESHQSPEAAASSEAVKEKAAVEKELLGKVKSSEATGESAKAADSQGSYYGVASSVPKPVEESLVAAHASPEATTETAVVAEKSNVEQELLKKVPHSDAAGEPAPTLAAATSATAPSTTAAVTEGAVDPALADEPAVRMMNQHDADATTSTGATATATTTEAAATKSEATEAKSDPAAVKSEPAEASPQTTEAKTTTTDKDSTPAAAATTSAASTPAGTPAKDNKSSLPSTSTPDGTPTKDKKKKHRVSAFFKKIFD